MALVPFSYASPFTDQLQLAERLFTIDGRLLKIRQAWKGDGKGGTDIGFGASVYPAAYVLAEYLERNPHLVRGKRVIELGTGTGFLGMAASILGATEVCLTDGDEQSLKLTQENVTSNLHSLSSGHSSPRTPACCDRRQQQQQQQQQQQPQDASPGNDDDGDTSKRIGVSDAAPAGGNAGDRRKPSDRRAANISVRKLRWGCEDDMRAVVGFPGGGGDGDSRCDGDDSGRPWDVVLGSDIAALPYASAYGDLLQTIVGLVNSGGQGGGGGEGENVPPSSRSGSRAPEEAMMNRDKRDEEVADAGSRGREGGRVVVLLAHKRRHVSEEAFFEDLKEELGGEKSAAREVGEGEIHADFRGTGIRLHLFQVDV